MAHFVAETPLNLRWRHRTGAVVEIVADRRNGVPWPPNTPFEIPDEIADDFAAEMGPQPGSAGVTPDVAREGRIAGLTRVG